MIESHTLQTRLASDSYTDLNSLNSINVLGREDKGKALEEISKQFESMLVRMMMQSMRDANKVFAKDSMLSSPQGDMYQQMYDDQLAVSLAKGKGLGLSEVMVKQLQQRFGVEEKSKAVKSFSLEGVVKPTSTNMMLNDGVVLEKIKSFDDSLKPSVVTPVSESVGGSKAISFDGSVNDFVTKLYDMAKNAAEKLNVNPKTLLAQAALETGWGKKITQGQSGDSSLNLFNIKAGPEWQGGSVKVSTLEFIDDVAVREKANFRSYQTIEQSFDDYVDFISGRARYDKAVQADSDEAYVKELSLAGYATDPRYADKISRIANSDAMNEALQGVEVN